MNQSKIFRMVRIYSIVMEDPFEVNECSVIVDVLTLKVIID